MVLFVSGLLEAFVTPAPLPNPLKDAFGFLVWAAFLVYVFVLGRKAHLEGESTDAPGEIREAALPAA